MCPPTALSKRIRPYSSINILPSGSSRDLITVFTISRIPIVNAMAFSNNNLSY